MEDLGFEIEVEGLCIEDRQSIFEDSIMPHQNSIHLFLFVLCCESRYFEDTVTFRIFRLRMSYNFFQVWTDIHSDKSESIKVLLYRGKKV